MERLVPKTLSEEKRVGDNALHQSVRRHALGWLMAANAVGLWLAALLLWPDLNDLTAPLTYGRWAPLHLDWQLYGWCALPLVGALFRFYLRGDSQSIRLGRVGLWLWTLALAYAGATWLAGGASGKLFLNFAGSARVAWPAMLFVLWFLLLRGSGPEFWQREPAERYLGTALITLLLPVPFLLYWAGDPAVNPPVNPHSGGATGASLLGSTLAVVLIFGWLPRLLRLPRNGKDYYYWPAFIVSAAFYAGMRHSQASHHEIGQIVGLGLLLAWIPFVVLRARKFRWHDGSVRWLTAAFAWWLLLVVTGFLTFLPGWSERLKFTNALVAHSHLAMAGLVTSLHVAVLLNLPGRWRPSSWSFWFWQAGCALQITVLGWLGWQEGEDPALLNLHGGVADWCYGLRFGAGLAMAAASLGWLRAAWKDDAENKQSIHRG